MPKKVELDHSALIVRQWLPEWEDVSFDPANNQAKPLDHFYLMSLSAAKLRSLAGIHIRDASDNTPRADDTNIQRRHDPDRSLEIRKYIREGFPYSALTATQRKKHGNVNLQKPGWLPTAIVVNILRPGDIRDGKVLNESDAIGIQGEVAKGRNSVEYSFPQSWTSAGWEPKGTYPIEIIDGQHRLWAFDPASDEELDFDLPVVAFFGLDISWQAYLFWTINIKPKKINASLAFDLYPLLREQDWLVAGEGLQVYRETRAQELTEALWATPESPWFRRINMLGDLGIRAEKPVTQAAFVRSLAATFVRPWGNNSATKIGGLFGGSSSEGTALGWSRIHQAGYLVMAWKILNQAVSETTAAWANELREKATDPQSEVGDRGTIVDIAFASSKSLLASDQGVRPVLAIFNDFSFLVRDDYALNKWQMHSESQDLKIEAISEVITKGEAQPIAGFLRELSEGLATYDWRNSTADLTPTERTGKMAFRGSGGYTELRRQLIAHLIANGTERIKAVAQMIQSFSS